MNYFYKNWRYQRGLPSVTESSIILGDSTIELEKVLQDSFNKNIKYSLLFTSPPYWSITNYYMDQWLRLRLLRGVPMPRTQKDKNKKRFHGKQEY